MPPSHPDILKTVWDLSDEDEDGHLSLREFCTASYLIERYKSGRKLPTTLPKGFHVDQPVSDTRLAIAAARLAEAQAALAQNTAGVNVPAWQNDPGEGQRVPGCCLLHTWVFACHR